MEKQLFVIINCIYSTVFTEDMRMKMYTFIIIIIIYKLSSVGSCVDFRPPFAFRKTKRHKSPEERLRITLEPLQRKNTHILQHFLR